MNCQIAQAKKNIETLELSNIRTTCVSRIFFEFFNFCEIYRTFSIEMAYNVCPTVIQKSDFTLRGWVVIEGAVRRVCVCVTLFHFFFVSDLFFWPRNVSDYCNKTRVRKLSFVCGASTIYPLTYISKCEIGARKYKSQRRISSLCVYVFLVMCVCVCGAVYTH